MPHVDLAFLKWGEKVGCELGHQMLRRHRSSKNVSTPGLRESDESFQPVNLLRNGSPGHGREADARACGASQEAYSPPDLDLRLIRHTSCAQGPAVARGPVAGPAIASPLYYWPRRILVYATPEGSPRYFTSAGDGSPRFTSALRPSMTHPDCFDFQKEL
jgi:hypothetical protein